MADTLQLSPDSLAAGLTVDNIWGLLYFPAIGALCTLQGKWKENGDVKTESASGRTTGNDLADGRGIPSPIDRSREESDSKNDEKSHSFALGVNEMAISLAMSIAIIATAQVLCPASVLPAATVITVVLATAAPSFFSQYSSAAEALGKLLLFQYFASAGAGGGSVLKVLQLAPLFTFCGIMYSVHLSIVALAAFAFPTLFREVRETFACVRLCTSP